MKDNEIKIPAEGDNWLEQVPPASADLPDENDLPNEADLPDENDLPDEADLPNEADLPVESELPADDEVAAMEEPANEETVTSEDDAPTEETLSEEETTEAVTKREKIATDIITGVSPENKEFTIEYNANGWDGAIVTRTTKVKVSYGSKTEQAPCTIKSGKITVDI